MRNTDQVYKLFMHLGREKSVLQCGGRRITTVNEGGKNAGIKYEGAPPLLLLSVLSASFIGSARGLQCLHYTEPNYFAPSPPGPFDKDEQ